jgi:3-isopropylmalate/(R)-2-methylmalate dehydratase small subunit
MRDHSWVHDMKFEKLTSRAARVERANIDTDQIIPARFLKVTERSGLGRHLFADWSLALDHDARILIAGDNFGCGSSREHAVWALMDHGCRAVIAIGFSDIFRQNALKNGLLPIALGAEDHARVLALPAEAALTVDLQTQTVSAEGLNAILFAIDGFSKTCLLEGVDELGYILKHEPQIRAFEASLI